MRWKESVVILAYAYGVCPALIERNTTNLNSMINPEIEPGILGVRVDRFHSYTPAVSVQNQFSSVYYILTFFTNSFLTTFSFSKNTYSA